MDAILEDMRDNILLDGVTLSGGEPFVQPEACTVIAEAAHAQGLNVWCYSGYTFEQLVNGSVQWLELLQNVDVLVDGPFVLAEQTLDAHFRGSANQRIVDVQASLKQNKVVLSTYN